MFIYIFVISIILFLRYHLTTINNSYQQRKLEKKYFMFICCILVLLAALRHLSVGADTISYASDYYEIDKLSISYINEYYKSYIGYYYLSKAFSSIGLPLIIWFGFIESIYIYAISKLILRYSQDLLLSILLFFTIGLFAFSLAGLKQVLSMSYMILAFLNYVDKKYLWFALCVLFSYLCHPAGLIFIAAFPIYSLSNKPYYWVVIVTSLIFMVLYSELFLSSMVNVLNDEHFETYLNYDNSYTPTTLIFYIILVIFSIFGFKHYVQLYPQQGKLFLGLSIFAVGLQFLSKISPNMFRLAYLYSPFFMILLPNTIKYSGKNKNLVAIALIAFVAFFFLYTARNTPYKFIWQ